MYDCTVAACVSSFWNVSVDACCVRNFLITIPKWTTHPDQTVCSDNERIPLTLSLCKRSLQAAISYSVIASGVCMKNQVLLFQSSISVWNMAVLIQNKSINLQPHDGTWTMKQWHKDQSVTMPWLRSSMKMLFHRSRSNWSLYRIPNHWVAVQSLPDLHTTLPKQSERPVESNYSTLLPLHGHWPLFSLHRFI